MRRRLAFAATCAVVAGSLLAAGPASARTMNPYELVGSFNGADSTAGAFVNPSYVAVDDETGSVYVLDAGLEGEGVLSKFDANGVAVPFSDPSLGGASSIEIGAWTSAGIAVDNSGGPGQGNIFVQRVQAFGGKTRLFGFKPSGAPLNDNWPVCGFDCGETGNWLETSGSVAVGPDGTPWVTTYPGFGGAPHALHPIDVEAGALSVENDLLFLSHTRDDLHGLRLVEGSTALDPGSIAIDSLGRTYVSALAVIGCISWSSIGNPDFPSSFPKLLAAVSPTLCPRSIAGYDADGDLLRTNLAPTVPSGSQRIAIDTSTDNLLVNFGDRIEIYSPEGEHLDTFGKGALLNSTGVVVNSATGDVYVTNRTANTVDIYKPAAAPVVVPDVETGPSINDQDNGVITGTINTDNGGATTECYFEFSVNTPSLQFKAPCEPSTALPSSGVPQDVSVNLYDIDCGNRSAVDPRKMGDGFLSCIEFESPNGYFATVNGHNWYYRVVVKNANGPSQSGEVRTFLNSEPPKMETPPTVREVNTDGAKVLAEDVAGEGGVTKMRVEYGTTPAYGSSIEEPLVDDPRHTYHYPADAEIEIPDLQPGTTYHYKVIAENERGSDETTNRTFRTFDKPLFNDPCPNAFVRQQTSAAWLPDCRAYELVSAAEQGGYDVASDLTPGHEPFGGYPLASDKLLYAVHDGAIPNTGVPTNNGPDPYVASRGDSGWSTKYVGVPGDIPFGSAPFASRPSGADSSLQTFAFGEGDVCDPCFADGSSGIPLRLPNGSLVQGMDGSLPVLDPTPAGEVRAPLSADGSHFVFGSEQKFEDDGLEGDLTLYVRDLSAGTTKVVSTDENGNTITGADLVGLDISSDGSRVLFGEHLGTDAEGNSLFALWMKIAGNEESIPLNPATGDGALYAGMSDDGTEVYFTTEEKLEVVETDSSIDLYRSDVGTDSATPTRISGADNDACTPASDWNGGGCDVLAIAGGGGVAPDGGAAYFLSPEDLDGNGTVDQPNLYLAEPGSTPVFVETLEASNPIAKAALESSELRDTAHFQLNSSGQVAAFTTTLSLKEGFDNKGFSHVYRYEAGEGEPTCVSCPITNATGTGNAALASNGLSITDDGRVFFNSRDPLVLRDSNNRQDAYEWNEGVVELISSGTSEAHSSLLSVTANGKDAFFFTRDKRSDLDLNGPVVKVYDAREGGGFFVNAPQQPCKASDECHGQGSAPPAIAQSQSTQGTAGQYVAPKAPARKCKRGFVKRRGKCVKQRKARGQRKASRKRNAIRKRHG